MFRTHKNRFEWKKIQIFLICPKTTKHLSYSKINWQACYQSIWINVDFMRHSDHDYHYYAQFWRLEDNKIAFNWGEPPKRVKRDTNLDDFIHLFSYYQLLLVSPRSQLLLVCMHRTRWYSPTISTVLQIVSSTSFITVRFHTNIFYANVHKFCSSWKMRTKLQDNKWIQNAY